MRHSDPFSDPEPLIRRVYAYVAYRIGDGPDAEDVAGDVLERALKYRESYDARKGDALAWLIGIARRQVDGLSPGRAFSHADPAELAAPGDLEQEAELRLMLAAAVASLGAEDRELIALRYGAGLSPREIGKHLNLRTNVVDVRLYRARARLKEYLQDEPATAVPAESPSR
jgi:RNA polymerase sigma-70 factor, ECF subfamily